MFSLNNFIMKTLKGMVGNYPDFQVMEYALNWYSKGKLTEEDLAEIETMIEAQYIEPPVVEGPIEDIPTDETEIEDETILDGEDGTETEVEESQTENEILDDSTNEEVVEESVKEPEAEPTESTE
jgi:hypothetical protein